MSRRELLSQKGDFTRFFAEVSPGLYSGLCLLARNRHEAEEITQEALAIVLERWDRVSLMDDPKAYLYRVAMNVFRKRRRRAALSLRSFIPTRQDDEIAAIEDRDEVIRILGTPAPRQRAAIVLTEGLGFTSEEAADLLRVRASTVRVLAFKARKKLQEGRDSYG